MLVLSNEPSEHNTCTIYNPAWLFFSSMRLNFNNLCIFTTIFSELLDYLTQTNIQKFLNCLRLFCHKMVFLIRIELLEHFVLCISFRQAQDIDLCF
jgi:hypothetical protein